MRKGQDVADTVEGRGVWTSCLLQEGKKVEEGKKEAGNGIGRRRRKRRRSVFTVSGCRERRKRSGGGRERRGRTKCEKNVCSRRPDGAAIDSMKKTLYSLELTRTTHERADVEQRARERAEQQYKDVIGGLTEVGRSMGRGWSVRLPTLVGGHQCVGVGTQEAAGRTSGGTSSP